MEGPFKSNLALMFKLNLDAANAESRRTAGKLFSNKIIWIDLP